MALSFERVRPLLLAHPGARQLWVGYSGGLDSHVLLHLLATRADLRTERSVSAVHVDHGLQPDSRAWARHCSAVCRALNVPLRSVAVCARPEKGQSPEAAAREARYRALSALIGPNGALLMAHHRDDQAETLLLQLLRGSGPHGLAAMPIAAPLGRGLLLRPLLEIERTEILAYAREHGLDWIEDQSNTDTGIDRNFLRHDILPRLKQRWPAAARTLSRSASLCAAAASLMDAQAAQDLLEAMHMDRPDCLDLRVLNALDEGRRCNVLRHWLGRLGLPRPSAAQLQRIIDDLLVAAPDRRPRVHWPGTELRRHREGLYAMVPLPDHDPAKTYELVPEEPLRLPGVGELLLKATRGRGLDRAALTGRPLSVRFRRGGEWFRPLGQSHRRTLKNLLRETGLAPWERDRVPLLYAGEELVAVAGLGVSAAFATPPHGTGLLLEWRREWQTTSPSGTV